MNSLVGFLVIHKFTMHWYACLFHGDCIINIEILLVVFNWTTRQQFWLNLTKLVCQQLDVFHQRNLQKDHVTNMEVLSRTGQRRLQDIVAERRLRMRGHIIRMPPGRPANHAMSWTPRGSGRRRFVQRRLGGLHLKKTWWTEVSIGTASGLWLQTEADGEHLLPIVLSRTGGSKC